ncbi:PqqD family protein [Chondromyces apiculatus]|nr:PqqD family protein [Chondromyces apiculatus]
MKGVSGEPLVVALPSLGLRLSVALEGVSSEHREALGARWSAGRDEEGRGAAAGTEVAVILRASSGEVGFPASALVAAATRWAGPRRGELRANGVEMALEVEGDALRGEGTFDEARPRGSVEAAVRALMTLALARRGVLVLHAAAVAHGGDAVVLLGASGAGKTTTARRLGREGLRRLSDDLIAIETKASPPVLHRLPFERAGRGPLRGAGEVARCRGGALVQKGAACVQVLEHGDPVRAWVEAVIALGPPPGEVEGLLKAVGRLCAVPLGVLEVPAQGALSPEVRRWIEALGEVAPFPVDASAGGPQARGAGVMREERGQAGRGARQVERAPNVAFRVLDGVVVLVAPSSPAIQTLNEVGSLVWQLADGRSLDAIVDAVVDAFEVEHAVAQADVERFVEALEARGMLRSRPSAAG